VPNDLSELPIVCRFKAIRLLISVIKLNFLAVRFIQSVELMTVYLISKPNTLSICVTFLDSKLFRAGSLCVHIQVDFGCF
jgi:hypothetical protein